jgi:hypothetical protein
MKKLFTFFFIIVTLSSNAQTDCNPTTITNVSHEGSGNRIVWTAPIGRGEVMISQGGDYVDWGTGAVQNFGVYHRFVPEELASLNNGELTHIVFAPTYNLLYQTKPGHIYTIQIYQGGSWGEVSIRNSGTLLVSQELNNENLLFNQENTITLETQVTIDASQELWIGYFCTNIDSIQDTYKLSAGTDTGPIKEGLGNIIFIDNQWNTLYELDYMHNYNWCIKGKVQTIEGATVNIYFNDNNIANNIPGTTYFHPTPIGEKQCYQVEVNCLEGGVSPLSNEFCLNVGINENEQGARFMLYPNPAKSEITITNYELRITDVEIYNVYGRKLSSHHFIPSSSHHIINVSSLSSGVYFVRLIDAQGSYVQKFVKE